MSIDALEFPADFWWGTGNSSTQCEGAAPASDWMAWEQTGQAPTSESGNGFAENYASDFNLLAEIGLNHFRLSLEWARLEPAAGQYDRSEIERYREILRAGRDMGLNMWVTAHHFTLPHWFTEMGGFGDERMRQNHWVRHIEFLAETFGDLVFGWKPINEPQAFALCGWLLGIHPPGIVDLSAAAHMLVATHLANHEAWRVLKEGPQPVATIHNLSPVIPITSSDDDIRAAELLDELTFGIWINMITDGVLRIPQIPGVEVPAPIEDNEFIDAFDVIGFSYYNATGVTSAPEMVDTGGVLPVPYPADHEVGPLGYVPWSGGLEMLLNRLDAELPTKPLLISEYGIGTTNDTVRVRHVEEGLRITSDAITRGVDLRGFFHWTGVDNYEWLYGYDVPFGLFDRDRNRRPSAGLIAAHART